MTRSLVESARIIGGYVWLEERLFETLGAWVPSIAEPEVKLRVAADSQHHAWHASLWRERLPALRELEGQTLGGGAFVAPPGPEWEAFVTALQASVTTIDRVVGVYRVGLARLVDTYQRHLEAASAITDGPTVRALRLVLADELDDWRAGELLVQRLLRSARDAEQASAHQGRLETLLVAGGGGRESNPPDGGRPSQPL